MKYAITIISVFSLLAGQFCFAKIPNDPYYTNQIYLDELNMQKVWDKSTGSNSVVVAIIDSGIDIFHEDIRNNIWVNQGEIADDGIDNDHNGYIDDIRGWDFYGNDNNPSPTYTADCGPATVCSPEGINHGTLVAGIIGAVGNNALGITGLNWQVRLMSIRILQQSGISDSRHIVDAVNYAVNNGAQIINMSFVGDTSFTEFKAALQNAYNHNVLIVASAGNGDNGGYNLNQSPIYPICYNTTKNENMVIGVGSSDRLGNISSFSNYGDSCVDVLAPGEDFFGLTHYDPNITNLNTLYDGYFSGTSMAAPVIAGIGALIKSLRPELDNKGIRDLIFESASWKDSYSGKVTYGLIDTGMLLKNIAASISLIKGSGAAVYYHAADGRRYVFPNQDTFYSWYKNFSTVRTISDTELAGILIGGNVTIRPGIKLVKITTDPKVYAVSHGGVLRWVTSEALAQQLYGSNWQSYLVDIADSFFVNYQMGTDIINVVDYNVQNEINSSLNIDSDKGL